MPTNLEKLLEKITDSEVRMQLSGVAAKVPDIENWIIDPDRRQHLDELDAWAATEWDSERGMTRNEWRQLQRITELEAQKGQDMTLEQLNARLDAWTGEKGIVTKSDLEGTVKAKEEAFDRQINLMGTLATRIPYLNAKYQKDFGEMFDPDEFVKQAGEKGYAQYGKEGLDRFYDEFTREKREAKLQAEIQAQIDAARKEERQKVLQETAMGQNGQMPTAEGAPVMGHFQRRIMGLDKKEGSPVPVDAELGRGTIARMAATAGDQNELAGRVN